MADTIHVRGLTELDRAFGRISKDLRRTVRDELALAAEPVRSDAESLSVANIENLGPTWGRMKTGVTSTLVYVAPKTRRGRNRNLARPNLAPLLQTQMDAALDQNEAQVVVGLEVAIDRLTAENGF